MEGCTLQPAIKGFLFVLLTAVLLSFIVALIFYLTPISEAYIYLFSLAIIAVSSFVGSTVGAKDIEAKGYLYGIMIGLMFFIFISLIPVFIPEPVTFGSILKKLVVCIATGACGGIVGMST